MSLPGSEAVACCRGRRQYDAIPLAGQSKVGFRVQAFLCVLKDNRSYRRDPNIRMAW